MWWLLIGRVLCEKSLLILHRHSVQRSLNAPFRCPTASTTKRAFEITIHPLVSRRCRIVPTNRLRATCVVCARCKEPRTFQVTVCLRD